MIHSRVFRAMGCEVEIKLETGLDGAAVLDTLPQRFDRLEDRLSRFRLHSELMQLNARAGTWVTVSEILFDNLLEARQAARQTEGLFNPLILPALVASGYDRNFDDIVPMSSTPPQSTPVWHSIGLRPKTRRVHLPAGSAVDLGGIAKGWTAQHIADDLAQYGPNLVNIGGDIVVRGAPEGLPGWPIHVDDPDGDEDLTTVWLRDAAIVTSGTDYRRWRTADGQRRHHIIDPYTSMPTQTDALSVTVIHPHAPTAEAFAKAILLKGAEPGLDWLNGHPSAAGLVVRQDSAVLSTANFVSYIQERINA
jgi:FAD:protein FMN transferase